MKLQNNQYDILKKIALYFLPALAALILGLSKVWNFPFGDEISQTIALVITFIDTILGGFLEYSSSLYWKEAKTVEVHDPKQSGIE